MAAQSQQDADSALAGSSLAAANTLCLSPTPAASTTPPASTTSTTVAGSEPAGSSAQGSAPTPGGAPTTCAEALAQATSDQAAVAADIKSVDQAESALEAAFKSSLSAAPATGSATTPTTTPAASAGKPSGGSSGTGSQTKEATPQQLALDQASIDTAQANLDDAQAALDGANLTSSISGTVASVSLVAGQSVSAGSSSTTPEIVVIGPGSSYQVTTDVAVADIGQVHVGQQARVTPNSTSSMITGNVSSIGVLATTATTGTTYPVTISLTSAQLGQLSGAEADVSVVVQRAVDVTRAQLGRAHHRHDPPGQRGVQRQDPIGTGHRGHRGGHPTADQVRRDARAGGVAGRFGRTATVHLLDHHPGLRRGRRLRGAADSAGPADSAGRGASAVGVAGSAGDRGDRALRSIVGCADGIGDPGRVGSPLVVGEDA